MQAARNWYAITDDMPRIVDILSNGIQATIRAQVAHEAVVADENVSTRVVRGQVAITYDLSGVIDASSGMS